MSDVTPGRAAHDAFFAAFGGPDIPDWPPIGPAGSREAWEAAAEAVLARGWPHAAQTAAERDQLRNWLDDFTHLVLDLGEARVCYPAEAIRKKAGLPPVTS